MAKLPDFKVFDFSGGLRTDKSDYEADRNELKRLINFDVDERGRLRRRRGIHQFGGTQSGKIIDNSTIFTRNTAGSSPTVYHTLIERDSSPDIWLIYSNWLTTAAAVGDTTLTVAANGLLAASGTVEIEGDLIAYTGKSGTTQLTGVTGIARAHPVGSLVNQIQAIATATTEDYRSGAFTSTINNLLFLNGRVGSATFDGATVTSVADADEPNALFSTNFRDRIYIAGSGATSADPRRVFFSDAGDGTSWTATSFFDVEDERGESVTGFAVLNDALGIFKMNSIFSYDEVQLKQQQWEVGAYNHRVIQKIGKVVYTFCPSGVYATNIFSSKKISDPVKKYLKGFQPTYDTTVGRTVVNTFAGQFEDKYILYIGSITEPETLSDVVLVYDTKKDNWTVHTGYTNFVHFASLSKFITGTTAVATNTITNQERESLFASDNGGKYFRLYDTRFLDNGATRTYRGGDLTYDVFSETITPISAVAETFYLDLGSPGSWKTFSYLNVFVEQGNVNIAYSLDKGAVFTDWIPLGNFKESRRRVPLKDKEGYRIALQISANSADALDILNGFVIETSSFNQAR